MSNTYRLSRLLVTASALAAAIGCGVDPEGELNESVVGQEVLGPPATVTATATATDRTTVSWSAVTGATKYYVLQSTSMAGPFTFINTTRAPGTALQVAHLTTNTEYCFQVRTEDGTGPGAPSATACTITPTGPAAPSAVVATQTAPDRIAVSWNAISGATKYYVYEAASLAGTYSYKATTLAPTTSLNVIVPVSTTRCYKIAASGPNGTSVQSTGACNTGLQAPTNVTATAVSASRINVSWTHAADAVKYYVYESRAGAALTFAGTVLVGSAPTLSRAGLTTGVEYCYQIRTQGNPTSNVSGYSLPPACATP